MKDMASIRKMRPLASSGSLAATDFAGSAGRNAFEDVFFGGKQEILAGIRQTRIAEAPGRQADRRQRLRQIFFPQNLYVVQLMSGGKKSHTANCHAVFVGVPLAYPSLLWQVLEESDCRLTNNTKFVDEALQRALVERTGGYVVILFKARQHNRVIACDMMCAIAENALCIDDVSQNLLDCPLAGSIRKFGGAAIIDILNNSVLCSSWAARIDTI